MTSPLVAIGSLSDGVGLVAGLLIGVGFGWFLERSGMGSAPKLAGQFYLRDLTVFKVMFTAIVTAMLGVFWLGWLGVVDVARIYVPETFIYPQLIGGLVFGAGFVMGGLCPGTSCVSASTGRIDGMMVVLGMLLGVLGTGISFRAIESLYNSGARGSFTLPQLLGIPYGVVAFAVVVLAITGFKVAEVVERRTATKSTI
jgi:uncharacterized membrane protein YedE/YeeE